MSESVLSTPGQQWLHWFERQSGFERLIVLSRAASPLFSRSAITKGGRMAQLCHGGDLSISDGHKVDVNTPRVVSPQRKSPKGILLAQHGRKWD